MPDEPLEQSLNQNVSVDDDTTRIESIQGLAVSVQSHSVAVVSNRVSGAPQPMVPAIEIRMKGDNLERLAAPLLMVIAQLRRPQKHLDLVRLRQSLTLEINSFDVKARSAGVADNKILLARYILCSVIDEFVLDTPWGANSNWSEHSMLNTFHQDSTGGQKFFIIVERILADPVNYVDLLEIVYICLQLGFLGKYRIMQSGLNQLVTIKNTIYRQICAQRSLSQHGYAVDINHLTPSMVPAVRRVLWRKLSVLTLVGLAFIYVVFFFLLENKAATVEKGLSAIVVDNSIVGQATGVRESKE